ncbi:DUF2225 domain-containing protein [Paenibacillus sp. H1-7]|uniref:DUF2225 domain-containing protein n=1 Tax=Paenibacillus sp. H1-7 TaxID=2282849 RepID=UPI001EF93746|nr:DUF2225 domain-containing protein [Paenibacillus sp. H1-7]ULL18423.1 DUF2225 domain-containing protein [Paenibacillus sp. H1-7]
MVEPLFQVKVECACCESAFQTSRVRPSFKKATHTDTDFCIHYKETNPDYYVVRICPYCGYASTENTSNVFTPAHKEAFYNKVAVNWQFKDYGGERSWDDAMYAYKLALLCAQIKNEKGRVVAGLLHHIAWLYRYKQDTEQERRFLQFALDAYTNVFETEGADLNNARLMYLMGELHRRLNQYKEAVKWFGRVINDKSIMDSAMIRACREQWAATREQMISEKIDMPEEMIHEG